MARSFSTLFFKAAKKLGRIQRAALNLAVPGASGKRAAASRRAAARRGANASRDGASPSLGLGRWEASRQFTDGLGRRLAFARYIPPGVPRQGMPLVVMLHGCRQTALSFAQGSRMNQWADALVSWCCTRSSPWPGRCSAAGAGSSPTRCTAAARPT
ncbi:PHB depolymerase family esterase [Achromobacter xylosoxidans]